MPRKKGFRGTPVKPAGFASIGKVFANRGDPMVTVREGQEKYGRNLDTENPDFDRYFAENAERERAANAALKPSQIDKGNAFRKSLVKGYDPQRAAANVILKMNEDIRKAQGVVNKNKPARPHRVKGGFYYFPDITDKIQGEPKHPPRPFLGHTKTEKKRG